MSADNQETPMSNEFLLKIPEASEDDSHTRKNKIYNDEGDDSESNLSGNDEVKNNEENSESMNDARCDSFKSFEFVDDDKKTHKTLRNGINKHSKRVRMVMSRKKSPLLTQNSNRNSKKVVLTKMKKMEERIEGLERNLGSCCCEENSNENLYRIEDLELLVNDTTEETKEELKKLNHSYHSNEKNHQEFKKNLEIVEEHINQVFESANDNENDVKHLTDITNHMKKANENKFATNRKNLNHFKYIVEETLKLFDKKSKADIDITQAQNRETLELRNALANMIFMISDLLQEIDSNMCSKLNEHNKNMVELTKESKEFEKIFYENFSSLTHGLGARSASPGHVYASAKGVKNGQIKLTFDKEIIQLPYHSSSEICARILKVHGQNKSISKRLQEMIWSNEAEEKVVLLVGVTGAGKSTLIDAITNFYYNIRYDDPYRLALIDLLDAEKMKKGNQATSQTDEITIYKLPYLENGNAKGFKLTIIDTPGVADTRGINQDKKIIEKLRYLFQDGKISFLNSVCFVSKAGDSRLTAGQKYIFDSLITNFGVDLVDNIMGLFTFDDGGPAKATDAFKEAKIGLTAHFKFNSQAMLHQRIYQTPVNKTIMMTMEAQDCVQFQHFYNNCDDFFGTLFRLPPVNTMKTAKVMKRKEELDEKRYHLNSKLQLILAKKEELRTHEDLLERYINKKEINKDYQEEVEVPKIVKQQYTQKGVFVTNCTKCTDAPSCHDDCRIERDDEKHRCIAMNTDGFCKKCKCHWSDHRNMDHKNILEKVKKTVTVEEIFEKYQDADKNARSEEQVLKNVKQEEKMLSDRFQTTVQEIRDCILELSKIAMKAAPTDSASYIDQMIATEKENQSSGYLKRIEELEKERKSAILLDKVINGGDIEGYKKLNSMTLEDRAENVKRTRRDKRYNGYDRAAPVNLQYVQDWTEVSSMLKLDEVDKLETVLKNLASYTEVKGTKFDRKKIKRLIDEIQSMCITINKEEEFSDNDIHGYAKVKKHSSENCHETNMFVNAANYKKEPKLSQGNNNKDNSEKIISNPTSTDNYSPSEKKLEEGVKTDQNVVNEFEKYPKRTAKSDELGSSSQNDEANRELCTPLLTLKRIHDGDSFNSILEYLQKELLKNWSDGDIHFLETIDLAELNQEEKSLYLKSLRKV